MFGFLVLSPTIAFLLAALLFPDTIDDNSDLKDHYFHNHRAFFLLASTLAPIDAVDTLLKGVPHFLAQGPLYLLTIARSTGLNLIAARSKSERFHKFFAVFFLFYLLVFIGINLRVLD